MDRRLALLPEGESYEEICAAFRWPKPERYNMARDVCDRHADDESRTALIYVDHEGRETRYGFRDLRRLSSRFAHVLEARGVGRGDRVAILLSQSPETAIGHLACYRMGAVALPLFTLFGEEALEYRLQNSGAKAVVTDAANLPKIEAIRDRLPALTLVIVTDSGGGDLKFWEALEQASDDYPPVDTAAEDPALLVYTSGTTGPPKGALHAHRTMIGHMPGVEWYHEFPPRPGDLFWTPADWAWIGGLMDVLMPGWFLGIPCLAFRARKFDPEEALAMMARYRVRNAFLPPTALKLLRQVPDPRARHDVRLRSVFTGGETMGIELLEWGRETFGITINEGYGQTEFNICVGNCSKIMEVRPGSMGRAVPGHVVEVVDDEGNVAAPGETGHIAFATPDPVAMLGYWGNEEATREKHRGRWMLSGDLGRKDEDGYFWFLGRDDDVITSAGYRIGPGEIEDCLMKHPAVAMAAAIGVPDPLRTEVVKAVIVPKQGVEATEALAAEIQEFVRTRLAAHEYPRLVEFVDALPLTATGKVRRKDLRERERRRAEEAGVTRDAAPGVAEGGS